MPSKLQKGSKEAKEWAKKMKEARMKKSIKGKSICVEDMSMSDNEDNENNNMCKCKCKMCGGYLGPM